MNDRTKIVLPDGSEYERPRDGAAGDRLAAADALSGYDALREVARAAGIDRRAFELRDYATAQWSELHEARKALRRAINFCEGRAGQDGYMTGAYATAFEEAEAEVARVNEEMNRRSRGPDPKDAPRPSVGERQLTGRGAPAVHARRDGLSLLTLDQPFPRGDGLAAGLTDDDCDALLGDLVRRQVGLEPRFPEMRGQHGLEPDSSGGTLVPTPLAGRIIDLSRNQSRVMQAGALTVPMDAETLKLARVTQDVTGQWRAEHVAVTESEMAFDAVTLSAKTFGAIARASIELIEDARGFSSILETSLAQAVALEFDRVALFGSGTGSEPQGLRTAAGLNEISMGTDGAAPTSYDELSNAVQLVWEANESPGNFILAPRSAGQYDRLKDTTNQPLQRPATVAERRFLPTNQVPVDETQGTSTDASSVFVGNWPSLLMGLRTSAIIEASRHAQGAGGSAFHQLQVVIRIYFRGDVAIARANHFTRIVGLTP